MSDGQPDEADHRAEQTSTTYGRVRRAPRYGPFMWTGGLIGVAVALVLTVLSRSMSSDEGETTGGLAANYSALQVFFYLGLFLAAVGVAVGVVVALVLERRR